MIKDDLYPTNKSINIYFKKNKNTSPKKLNDYCNTMLVPRKSSHSKKFKFYPSSRNFSNLYNSNRKYEIDNLYFNSLINNDSQIKNLKLCPIYNRTIFNSEQKKRSSENPKSKSSFNKYIKNQTLQSDFYLRNEIKNRHNNNKNKKLINFILNKKLKTYKAKKLKEISLNSSNILDNLYGKGIFEKKFERNYMMKSKPLKYYFGNKNKTSRSTDKKNNFLSLFDKNDDNLSHNKKYFETIELGDKKEIFAIKLLNDDNDNDNERNKDNNIDCHSLMKYPANFNYIKSSKNYSSNLNNFFPSLRAKLRAINFKSKDNKNLNFHDIKLLSKKGYDNMKKNRKFGVSKQIYDTLEEIESNRKKFDLILDSNLKIFNKNKEEMLNIKI